MTNIVSIQAKAHQFLAEKYKGQTVQPFASLINPLLAQSGIQLNYNEPKERREALKAFLNHMDFKTILVDTLNNLLIDKWSATSETWRIWVNNYGLTDFKPTQVTAVSVVPKPEIVAPGAEYQFTELHGEQTSAKLDTYGNLINIERQTIFSDDISAINSFLGGVAAAYDRQIGDKVYEFLTQNPVSFNDKEIFHADHNNIVTATSDFTADLGTALELMCGQQVDISASTQESVRVQPKYIIVPPSKAITAAKIIGEYNQAVTEQQKLVVIVESRLIGFDGWFVACDNPFASIALFTLRERTIPEIFTNSVFNTDGLQVKHRMDYDVAPTDYRGLVRVS